MIKFKMDNVEIDGRKIARKYIKDVLVKEGATEYMAEKLANTTYMIVEKNMGYAIEYGMMSLLDTIESLTDKDFEDFVKVLRLKREEIRKGRE
mgnify:CR=1 FL=1